jgi:hypothetical protein
VYGGKVDLSRRKATHRYTHSHPAPDLPGSICPRPDFRPGCHLFSWCEKGFKRWCPTEFPWYPGVEAVCSETWRLVITAGVESAMNGYLLSWRYKPRYSNYKNTAISERPSLRVWRASDVSWYLLNGVSQGRPSPFSCLDALARRALSETRHQTHQIYLKAVFGWSRLNFPPAR